MGHILKVISVCTFLPLFECRFFMSGFPSTFYEYWKAGTVRNVHVLSWKSFVSSHLRSCKALSRCWMYIVDDCTSKNGFALVQLDFVVVIFWFSPMGKTPSTTRLPILGCSLLIPTMQGIHAPAIAWNKCLTVSRVKMDWESCECPETSKVRVCRNLWGHNHCES